MNEDENKSREEDDLSSHGESTSIVTEAKPASPSKSRDAAGQIAPKKKKKSPSEKKPAAKKKKAVVKKKKVAKKSKADVEFKKKSLQSTADDFSWNHNETDGGSSTGRRLDIADGLGTLIGGVRSLSNSAIKLAREKTVDSASRMISQSPDQLERMAKAGRSLQDLRNVTGASIEDVAGAIDLNNPDLLKAVEEGKAALPFEILLRLSSFYARNNPIPFILNYTRTYNPLVSKTLEKIGLDKLVIEAEREIQFVQILRSRDEARELSDEDYKRVHAFTEKAFEMALNFAAQNDPED